MVEVAKVQSALPRTILRAIVVATSTSCYIPGSRLVWIRVNYFDLDDFAGYLAPTNGLSR